MDTDSDTEESVLSLPQCTICFHKYQESEGVKPFVGKCGHTVCQKCAVKVKADKCPKCRKPKAFASPTVNYELMEHLTQQRKDREKISELMKDKDTKLEKLSSENKRLRQYEKKVKEGPQYKGPKCSKCGYPMKDDSAFLCVSCLDPRTKAEVSIGEFDDFDSLLEKVICGSCVLKFHKKHDSEEFLSLQIKRKAVKCKENLTRNLNATTHRVDIIKGRNELIGQIDELFKSLKTNYLKACDVLSDSSSLIDFERREDQLLSAMTAVDEEMNVVTSSLYQLKYRLQRAVDTSKEVIEALEEKKENKSDFVQLDSPIRGNAHIKEEVVSPLPIDPGSPGPSYRGIMSAPDSYEPLPIAPGFMEDTNMIDERVESPSWPAYSPSSPVMIGSRLESKFTKPGPPARKRHRGERVDMIPKRVFKFLDLDRPVIEKLIPMVESLGGKVVPSGMFSPLDVTHVVCGKLALSVNVLSCIAKGCWFLKTDYIKDSEDVETWLPERLYEWGNPDITETSALMLDELLLVSAAQRWRNTLANSGWNTSGAFAEWRVLLYVSPEKCTTTLIPILSSGGAVFVIRQNHSGSVADFAPTHVFVGDDSSWNKKELSMVVAVGAKVLTPDYIWNFLQSESICDEEYFHEDYKNLQR